MGHERPYRIDFPAGSTGAAYNGKLISSGDLCPVLDEFYERLQSAPSTAVVDEMLRKLATFYDRAAQDEMLVHFRGACQSHPLHRITLEDPFTKRC